MEQNEFYVPGYWIDSVLGFIGAYYRQSTWVMIHVFGLLQLTVLDFGEYLDEYKNKPAQKQAEEAFDGFILWAKRGTFWSAFFLCLVVFACNNGVETGLMQQAVSTMENNIITNLKVK